MITAYHPGTPAYKNNFPERNAIISALSEGTLIVEAPKHSGALITADCAAEQSRTVYALPGSIEEPMSEGPNMLIKNGAMAITGARDILEYYFENHSPLVNSVKLRQGELSSDFDMGILEEVGISVTNLRKGPRETPASLLKKLNSELNDNKEQNSDYYSIPKIKKISEQENVETESDTRSVVDQAVFDSLSSDEKHVFNDLHCDRPMSVEELTKLGHDVSSLMATLTMLEIKGLISSLPGGMYIRK